MPGIQYDIIGNAYDQAKIEKTLVTISGQKTPTFCRLVAWVEANEKDSAILPLVGQLKDILLE